MLISHYVTNIQNDLTSLGQLGGDEMTAISGRLAAAVEPALRGRLFEALNQIVAEANDAAPTLRLELRLAGDEVSLVRNEPNVENVENAPGPAARFALRLPEELKAVIEEHANKAGASTNSYIVRALAKELGDAGAKKGNRPGRTLKGTGQS